MKPCPQCKEPNSDKLNFCGYCGIPLDVKLPLCPNSKCKKEHIESANFCLHCGYALTEYAKQKVKREKREDLRKLNNEIEELKNEQEKLKEHLSERNKKNGDLNLKLDLASKEIEKYKEIVKENKTQIMPKWFLIVCSIITGVLLLLLILIITGVL